MGFTNDNPSFTQRHYTVAELASLWGVSEDTIRRLFRDKDVLLIHKPRRRTRTYKSIRIPEAVAAQVYNQLTKGGRNGSN